MRPLFDENLSDRLPRLLADLFPGGEHVTHLGLGQADDSVIRQFAAASGFTVVTKDRDHSDLALAFGIPPKVLWVRLGNCSARRVETAMRFHAAALIAFVADPVAEVYQLY